MKDIVNKVKKSGKSLHSYYKLRDKGYSEEEAFELAITKGTKSPIVKIDDKEYSIKEAMKILPCDVAYSTVMSRIKFGMSPYEAITRPALKKY